MDLIYEKEDHIGPYFIFEFRPYSPIPIKGRKTLSFQELHILPLVAIMDVAMSDVVLSRAQCVLHRNSGIDLA